jgi:isopentenyldiphosphate isomerase
MHENEFVYVYFGDLTASVKPNLDEIINIDFLTPYEIHRRMRLEPNSFTYWLKYYFRAHYAEISKYST